MYKHLGGGGILQQVSDFIYSREFWLISRALLAALTATTREMEGPLYVLDVF